MRCGTMFWAIPLIGLTATLGRAQDDPPKPAAAGTVPAGFRSYIVTDERFPPLVMPVTRPEHRDPRDRTNKMHDLVVEQGLNPVVAVFTRTAPAADGPVSKLVKAINELPIRHRTALDKGKQVNIVSPFVIYLLLQKEYQEDEQRDVEAQKIRDLAKQLSTPKVAYGLAATKSPLTTSWGLSDADETVVVLYHRMKLVQRWAFKATEPSDVQIAEIIAAADKEAGLK